MLAEILSLSLSVVAYLGLRRRRQNREIKRPRRWWARPIFRLEQRKRQGHHHNLVREMRLKDVESHFNFLRMSPARWVLECPLPDLTQSVSSFPSARAEFFFEFPELCTATVASGVFES